MVSNVRSPPDARAPRSGPAGSGGRVSGAVARQVVATMTLWKEHLLYPIRGPCDRAKSKAPVRDAPCYAEPTAENSSPPGNSFTREDAMALTVAERAVPGAGIQPALFTVDVKSECPCSCHSREISSSIYSSRITKRCGRLRWRCGSPPRESLLCDSQRAVRKIAASVSS